MPLYSRPLLPFRCGRYSEALIRGFMPFSLVMLSGQPEHGRTVSGEFVCTLKADIQRTEPSRCQLGKVMKVDVGTACT